MILNIISESFGFLKQPISEINKSLFALLIKDKKILLYQALPLQTVKIKPSGEIIGSLNNALLLVAAGLAILFIIIGGVQYFRGWGETERLMKAKKMIYYVVLGLTIILISYAAVVTLNNALNI